MSTPNQDQEQSVYMQCAASIDRLIENPPAKKHGGVGIFIELDVIADAAGKDWGKGQYDEAMHEANEICGQRYRKGKLCRYGPVKIGRGSSKIEDYARIAGKIVYADVLNGPAYWETPNGKFKKLLFENDTMSKQGRTTGANRHDGLPWDEQVLPNPAPKKKLKRITPKVDEDDDIGKLVIELSRRVKALEESEERRKKALAAAIAA